MGHWQNRTLLLIIWRVTVGDEGTYVCAVNGTAVTQEAAAHLDVTAIGHQPTLARDLQEDSWCHYTCRSKRWYPKPDITWTNYGGDTLNVEAKTNITWSEKDHFVVQSTIQVPCETVDVVCVVKLIESKISLSGSLNELLLPQSSTCTYKGRTRGSYVDPKVMWLNPQGEDLSALAQTSILLEMGNIFEIESSIEIPCGQLPPSFVATDKESSPQVAQQAENINLFWIIYLLPLIILQAHLQRQKGELQTQLRTSQDAEKGKQKEMGECCCVLGDPAWKKIMGDSARIAHCDPKIFPFYPKLGLLDPQNINFDPEIFHFDPKFAHFDPPICPFYPKIAHEIQVDEDSAHPNLSISGDKKSFTHQTQAQKMTQNEESFDSTVCVLGSQGFSSGKHYWEVEVEKSNNWDLGVARRSAPRKGIVSLSPKEGFWVLGLSFNDYWARTEPWTRLVVQKNPRKIGVFLNLEEKILSFYNVTDTSIMFTFKDCDFFEDIYPFFKNSHKESTLRICSVKEE
ncbi:PREDICTED: butyrophilin subfamily 3 member A3-like [Chaetura pelagica]|uniref:butyrophilin subfamily 3 member A3-like n=1 Tax=Chaetura pelagica TaxID=8897 RepID=UPI0005231D97|nr:PREDICTED: butyrophilin subfamily 3 member A3-like [Chaetura pelagica]